MTLLVSLASAQEVVGGGATNDDHAYKGAMKEMSRLKEVRVVTVKGNENWNKTIGFGKDADMIEMMTLMMVGGSGMERMKMAGMSSSMHMGSTGAMETGGEDEKGNMAMASEQGLPAIVTLKQNPPVVGENRMDVLVTDASGKPVKGLKLMATVAMTSMDMGTERPKLVEGKDGHYAIPVKFSMKGPWRVTLMNDGKVDKSNAVHTTLDFNVDGKTKWTQPKAMAGMKMQTGTKTSADDMAGMEMPAKVVSGTKTPGTDTTIVKTPVAVATVTKTPAKSTVDTKAVASDMAGMKMPTAESASGAWNVTVNTNTKTLTVGKNMLDVTILDPAGKPVTGAKVVGLVEMTSMDMGITKPKALEGKNGHYTVPVQFSMKGPWRVTLTVMPPKQKPFTKALEFKVGP